MAKTKLEAFAEEVIAEQVESLDERIEELNKRLEVYDRVKLERDKLMMARRALLGVGSKTTNSGGSRIQQAEVVRALEASNGSGMHVADIVAAIPGSNDAQIRGHLNRGNGERFLKRGDNKWFLRDPEVGVNSVEDLPDEQEAS